MLTCGGHVLMLVKPQFELQPSDIGKGGLVKDPASYPKVEARLRQVCADLGLKVLGYWPSAIAGGDGNKEFWIGARRDKPQSEH
jgi:23S rRNA (cytidine1920-2'-O)/16S rRNA (cytidine1409-2'-O)-methyltransferase